MPPPTDDRELRFRDLLREYYPRLRRVAQSHAARGEDEDLLQEILAQIWRSLPGFDSRAELSTWVYRIALNTALTTLRQRYRRPAMHAMAPDELLPLAPSSVGDPKDPGALLDAFLASLPPIDRSVLMLSLDDLSYTEIAEITGLGVNAIGIRLSRIKQRFNHDYVEGHP